MAAWQMIRELVGADPALNEAAWESLREVAEVVGEVEGPRLTGTAGYFEF